MSKNRGEDTDDINTTYISRKLSRYFGYAISKCFEYPQLLAHLAGLELHRIAAVLFNLRGMPKICL
jgi:hypothetical protein